jgi:hypothetical protein
VPRGVTLAVILSAMPSRGKRRLRPTVLFPAEIRLQEPRLARPLRFLVRVGSVMTRHTRCVVTSPDSSVRQRRVGALTFSSKRASNGKQVDQGVARKA